MWQLRELALGVGAATYSLSSLPAFSSEDKRLSLLGHLSDLRESASALKLKKCANSNPGAKQTYNYFNLLLPISLGDFPSNKNPLLVNGNREKCENLLVFYMDNYYLAWRL